MGVGGPETSERGGQRLPARFESARARAARPGGRPGLLRPRRARSRRGSCRARPAAVSARRPTVVFAKLRSLDDVAKPGQEVAANHQPLLRVLLGLQLVDVEFCPIGCLGVLGHRPDLRDERLEQRRRQDRPAARRRGPPRVRLAGTRRTWNPARRSAPARSRSRVRGTRGRTASTDGCDRPSTRTRSPSRSATAVAANTTCRSLRFHQVCSVAGIRVFVVEATVQRVGR